MSDNCKKCGKPKDKAGSGSITQWISSCNCDLKTLSDATGEPRLCSTCGKRIRVRRAGSMTQWVFGPDSCACPRPTVSSNNQGDGADEQNSPHEAEEEIYVDPQLFPLDRYKPIDTLGQGVSGEVYLCRDKLLGKKVAVKTLRQLTPEQLVTFQLEAKATSALRHPNIVH